jgi:four helix bundle protein
VQLLQKGSGRFNYRDNSRFIKIARGSLYKTKKWLRRAYRRKLLTDAHIEKIKQILEELLPKLNAYLNSIIKNNTSDSFLIIESQ